MSQLRRNKKADEILFHHRYPTSTSNVRNACHPFSTKKVFEYYNYVLVHNGVLWNENELKKEHEKLGIKYVSEQLDGSFNDSEALTYDVARYLEGQVDKITAKGNIAFICVQRSHDGEPVALYFGRNTGNPLKMKMTENSITLSSEGDGEMIKPDTMYRFDYTSYKLTESYVTIPEVGTTLGASYTSSQYALPTYLEQEEYEEEFYYYIQGEVKERKNSLMYEGMENVENAYELGLDALDDIEKRIGILEKKELADTITDDEYVELGDLQDEQYYLKQAVLSLEKEVQRQQSQDSFHLNGKFVPTEGDRFPTGTTFSD